MNHKRVTALFTTLSRRGWKTLLIAFLLYVSPVLLFIAVADEVRENDTLAYDEALLRVVHQTKSALLDVIVPMLTDLGGTVGVICITTLAVLALWYWQSRRSALFVLVGVGGAASLNLFLKAVFQRDRPQLWERLITENSYSFPSGHAMVSSALALSFVLLFWHTRYRWIAVGIASAYVLMVAFTRLYLGVHYPTDIFAGWMLSASWVAIAYAVILKQKRVKV